MSNYQQDPNQSPAGQINHSTDIELYVSTNDLNKVKSVVSPSSEERITMPEIFRCTQNPRAGVNERNTTQIEDMTTEELSAHPHEAMNKPLEESELDESRNREPLDSLCSEIETFYQSKSPAVQSESTLPAEDLKYILQEFNSLKQKVEDQITLLEAKCSDFGERVRTIEGYLMHHGGPEKVHSLQDQITHMDYCNRILENRVGRICQNLKGVHELLVREDEQYKEITRTLDTLAVDIQQLPRREEIELFREELLTSKGNERHLDDVIQSKLNRLYLMEIKRLSEAISEVIKQVQTLQEEIQLLRYNSEAGRGVDPDTYVRKEIFEEWVSDVCKMTNTLDRSIKNVIRAILQLNKDPKTFAGNMDNLRLDTDDYLQTLEMDSQPCSEDSQDGQQYECQIEEALETTEARDTGPNEVIDNPLELATSVASLAADYNEIQPQVNDLMNWRATVKWPDTAELQEMKEEIKKLQEDSRVKNEAITELQNLVSEHEERLDGHSSWTENVEDWKEEVSSQMDQFTEKLKANTLATIDFVKQTNDLKTAMEKKMVELFNIGTASGGYGHDKLNVFETEQKKRLKAFEEELTDEIKKLHTEKLKQFEEFKRDLEREQYEERISYMEQVRQYVKKQTEEVQEECSKKSKECNEAATHVMDTLDTLMGLKDYRVIAKE